MFLFVNTGLELHGQSILQILCEKNIFNQLLGVNLEPSVPRGFFHAGALPTALGHLPPST